MGGRLMIELIYYSRIATTLELPEIYKILKQSLGRNASRQITGALLFNTRYFLQVLEGLEADVDELYKRIQADQRHSQVQLISRLPLIQRRWSQWSMALITPGISNQELMRTYCGSEEFTPTELDAENARTLMLKLTKLTVPIT